MTIIPRTLKFRTQPREIEAVRFDGSNAEEVIEWVGSDLCESRTAGRSDFTRSLLVTTPEGVRRADKGDWIIKEELGVFYPLKPDLFETKFQPIEELESEQAHVSQVNDAILGPTNERDRTERTPLSHTSRVVFSRCRP
jgi:hypothetical protein